MSHSWKYGWRRKETKKEAEKIDSEEELEDDVCEAVSKRTWTDILLQIYRAGR